MSTLPAQAATSGDLEAQLDALPALDIADVAERTIERTFAATTAADVLASPEATSLGDLAGQVVRIVRITGAIPSSYDSGPSRYLVMDVADAAGEVRAVTCGSPYVIARVLRLATLGALPATVRVVELESRSHPGQSSLWVVAP